MKKLNSKEREKFLSAYFFQPVSNLKYIESGIENDNYLVKVGKKKFVLKMYNFSREKSQIEQEVEILNYLKTNNILVPEVIPSLNNNSIEEINGKILVLFSFLSGSHPKWELMNRDLARDIGRKLGELQSVLLKSSLKMKCISEVSSTIRPKQVNNNLQEFFNKINLELEKIDFKNLKRGTIHSDITRENIKVKDQRLVGFLDFDDLHEDYLVWDLAIAINHLFIAKSFGIDRGGLRSFLKGYKNVINLNNDEKKALIPFMILRNINLIQIIERKMKSENSKELNSIKNSLLKKLDLIKENEPELSEIFNNIL